MIELRNETERDVGLVVVILKDGEEIGRMRWADFLASRPLSRAKDHWHVEQRNEAERERYLRTGSL